MRITDTRKTELKIVELYKQGKSGNASAAKSIRKILYILNWISVYTGEPHEQVFTMLYLCEENILSVGVKVMSDNLFLDPRTLFSRRKKYCRIANLVLENKLHF